MMSNVIVITDSSAYLPPFQTDSLPVEVIPLYLTWEGNSYADGIDLQPEDFFRRLSRSSEMPRTSQIPLQTFLNVYHRWLEKGYDILSIHISSKVSGTVTAAIQAARELATDKIRVFDSLTGAAAMAFQVVEAARAAAQGATLAECERIARKIRDASHTYFIPGTLEFLHRGGRIGGAAALLGSALKIHPILETRNGVIESCEKVRTMSRAMQRMVDLMEKRVGNCGRIMAASLYADLPELAETLLNLVKQRLGNRLHQTWFSTISPVIGAHIGPGAVGMAFTCHQD
ncbi:MAG: DegV family protein [Chloroflexota bacterium]